MGQEDRYGIRESSPCYRFLQQETGPRRQTGRRGGDNFMLEFALVSAPTSTHRVHHGEPRSKMLCGTIMRDGETFQEMECAKTSS